MADSIYTNSHDHLEHICAALELRGYEPHVIATPGGQPIGMSLSFSNVARPLDSSDRDHKSLLAAFADAGWGAVDRAKALTLATFLLHSGRKRYVIREE